VQTEGVTVFGFEIDGIPLHPLVVHASVVLVPLAWLALVAIGWKATWRQAYGLPVLLLTAGGWLSSYIATLTGGPLESRLRDVALAAGRDRPRFGDHPEMGNQAAVAALALLILVVALLAADRWGARRGLPGWLPSALYGLSSLVGAGAVLMIVRAGHSGALLAWGA